MLKAFRAEYDSIGMTEVTLPAWFRPRSRGGSTLFSFDYYGQPAYLTQSSQLYLETCLPRSATSFASRSRSAPKSRTPVATSPSTPTSKANSPSSPSMTSSSISSSSSAEPSLASSKTREQMALLDQLNPNFKMPSRPFRRMNYKEAIQWLNDHNIPNEDGQPHKIGDDIAEAAERKMTDEHNVPIFLCGFPREIKSFYMKRTEGDEEFTDSVDVLMPGVGEIVGGSMRMPIRRSCWRRTRPRGSMRLRTSGTRIRGSTVPASMVGTDWGGEVLGVVDQHVGRLVRRVFTPGGLVVALLRRTFTNLMRSHCDVKKSLVWTVR